MRAATFQGKGDIDVRQMPDPAIVNPRDCIIEVTSTAICGSDLHLYDGVIPAVEKDDILGHEFMGRVVAVGKDSMLEVGQRVVVPFTIFCGQCFHCSEQRYSNCDNSCPVEDQEVAEKAFGHPMAGMFGYSHLTGGYAGGQAEYVRIPYSDVVPLVVPEDIPDERLLFLSDILPTGWMAALNAEIAPGDTIAVWGCGPVGLFTILSAFQQKAGRVIAIDGVQGRLDMAEQLGAEPVNFHETDILDALKQMTGGIGPDAVIDAVGMEAHGFVVDNIADRIKQTVGLGQDRAHVLRQAIMACRKGGRVSVPGVYGGKADLFPLGAMMQKGLQLRTGQTHVRRYTAELLDLIERDVIDPSFLISHRLPLDEAATGYRNFRDHQNEWIKVVMHP
ncbi:zinc-dependent alcohol dehydrogenase [Blastomonas sp. CCH5-A3]|uniref:zinc-dependent alcohol dehydrogenase n=1 Tax=Blastomonas sp. CCH5-A3 TaxID=1768761 RepID=UPI00082533AB|nr:zinc-dependent alcohol dehydrogenase [Blastomonas sp. CCH5-A3]MAF60249.1 glutathione-dependent formaldehyde dehydrogenase [Blastomonas sp.]|tara:strand:+ start:97732 stop:98901 length:1170 start_codon:yes stop_codon:yes gene_type:complete